MCNPEIRVNTTSNHGYPYQVVCVEHDAMSLTIGRRDIAEDVVARHVAHPKGKAIPAEGEPGDFMYRPAKVELALPWRASTGDRIANGD